MKKSFLFFRLNFCLATKDANFNSYRKFQCLYRSHPNPTDSFIFVELIAFVLLFSNLQNSSRLSGPDVNQAKDEFEDHLACLVYHSTTGVFHQPVGRIFASQVCPFNKSV